MALFVLGAGATRGASFVDPVKNPCLPPLDLDFYAQLQRIANSKHQKTVREVIPRHGRFVWRQLPSHDGGGVHNT